MGLTYGPDLSQLKRDLAALGDFDGLALNEKIGEVLVSSTMERFEEEKGPDGKPWPKSIRASTEGGQTLSKTGGSGLKNSFTHRATATMVEVGTNKKYASVHQNGMVIKPKKANCLRFQIGGRWVTKKQVTIPKRPFLGISDKDVEEIDGTILDHIKGR